MPGRSLRHLLHSIVLIAVISIIAALFASGASAPLVARASTLADSPTPTALPGAVDLLVNSNDQGLLDGKTNLEVFGPKQCYPYGDPFSPDLTTSPVNPYYYDINPPRIYTYRIAIPADYNQDGKHELVRVELFDPQTGNFNDNGGDGRMSLPADPATNYAYLPTWVEAPSLATVTISGSNQCGGSGNQESPCLQGGPVGSGFEIDPQNPFWYVRMDEVRGPNCGASAYTSTYLTDTKFSLYYYRELPSGSLQRTYLAQYTGKKDTGVEQAEARRTTLMWVSPTQNNGSNPTSPDEQMKAFSCTDINGDPAGTGKCSGMSADNSLVSSPQEPRVQVDGVPCSSGATVGGAPCPPEYDGTPTSVNPDLPADFSANSNGDFVINLSGQDFTDLHGNVTEPADEADSIYTDPATGTRYIYMDVESRNGSSENNYMVWAGPSPAEDAADITRVAPAFINARQTYLYNKMLIPSDPAYHSSDGISVFGVGDLPINSLTGARVHKPIAYFGPEYAGKTISVNLFDADSGTYPPIQFYFDNIPQATWSQCWEDKGWSTTSAELNSQNVHNATTTCDAEGSTQTWQVNRPTPRDGSSRHLFGSSCNEDFGSCAQWAPFTFTVPSASDPLHPVAFNGGNLMVDMQNGNTDTYNMEVSVLPDVPTLIAPADGAVVLGTPAYSWSDTGSILAYQFEYDTVPSFIHPVYGSDEIVATSFTPPLQSPGTYYWHVRAENPAHKLSEWSAYWTVNVQYLAPPAQPTGLTATHVTNTEIDLTWTDNSSSESGFKVQRRPNGTLTWTTIATTAANATSYQDTGVPCGAYDYQVIATNAGGDSIPSNIASATSLICPPAAPTNLTATRLSDTQINLVWADHAYNETGFKIQRRVSGTTTWGTIFTTAASAMIYHDTGVPCGPFDYQVIATNAGGDSAPTNTVTATAIVCAPNAPSDLTATRASDTGIDLAWTRHSTDETGFKVERSPSGTNTWELLTTTAAGATSYSDIGVSCGAFDYQVIATNIGGDSAPSNPATATALVCAPNAPSDLMATRFSDTQIDLTWISHSTDETGFKVERSPNGTNTWELLTTTAAGAVSYSDINVPCGTYDYQVIATNDGGDSAPSNVATAAALACPAPPDPASGLSATVISRHEVDLTWADNSNDETGFKVQRRVSGTTAWGPITTAAPDATGYHDMTVACATHYDYQVVATNLAGDSTPSNLATAVTPACLTGKPGQPKITTPSKTLLTKNPTPTFGWTAVGNADTYHLQISASSSFKTIKQDRPGLLGRTYTAVTLADGVYYVRVQAVNSLGVSGKWSLVRKITIDTKPPKVPAFKATITTSIQPTLQAITSAGAVRYQFQVSTDSGFGVGTVLVDVKTTIPSYKLTAAQRLQHHVQYYWRIRTFDQAGNASAWSIGWSFTIHD